MVSLRISLDGQGVVLIFAILPSFCQLRVNEVKFFYILSTTNHSTRYSCESPLGCSNKVTKIAIIDCIFIY